MAVAAPRRPPRTFSRNFISVEPEVDGEHTNSTLLDRLMSMGFPQNRSEKAIATTGCLDEEQIGDCVNWLLAHVDDHTLDDNNERDYILYMCPASGPLCDMLNKFWAETQKSAPNGAHESFPHIRITTFSRVGNRMMPSLLQTVETTLLSSPHVLSNYELDYQSLTDTAYKYVGLFLSDADDNKLHDLADEISVNASKIGVKIEPYARHMHMSLAYRFSDEHQQKIEDLASKIDTSAKCNWELKVYSRDIRIPSHELREVTHEYKAQQSDEINLCIGDIILTVPDSIQNSVDGWYTGFSLNNGQLGVFPGCYTVKSAVEHKAWTLVKKFPMVSNKKQEKVGLYENVNCDSRVIPDGVEPVLKGNNEFNMMIIRHAERVDAVMGKDWVKTCFEDSGKDKFLRRFNLNMPETYVKRRSINDFERDPPITVVGRLQAKLIGKAIAASNYNVKAIYSSPSLRCIETADVICKQLDADRRPQIKVENCLFEWNRWHSVLPTFIPPSELQEQGFNIDTSYKPEMLAFDLMESLEAYYDRSCKLCQNIIDKHSRGGGCVLLIGHAATAEACLRKLSKRPLPPQREFVALINKIPFCEPILAAKVEGIWTATSPTIPKLWHLDNKRFDVKILNGLQQ